MSLSYSNFLAKATGNFLSNCLCYLHEQKWTTTSLLVFILLFQALSLLLAGCTAQTFHTRTLPFHIGGQRDKGAFQNE